MCVEIYGHSDDVEVNFELSQVWIPQPWKDLPPGAENSTLVTESVNVTADGMALSSFMVITISCFVPYFILFCIFWVVASFHRC